MRNRETDQSQEITFVIASASRGAGSVWPQQELAG
jgi:hypothetical protein